jgi:hypothetical protein
MDFYFTPAASFAVLQSQCGLAFIWEMGKDVPRSWSSRGIQATSLTNKSSN